MIGWTRQWTFFVAGMVVLHLVLRVTAGLGGIVPDLLTATALLSARRLPLSGAIAFGFCTGLLADAFAVDAYAATGLGLAVACGLGSFSRDYFEGESLLFTAVYVLVGATLAGVIGEGLAQRTGGTVVTVLFGSLLTATWTAVAASIALAGYREVTGPRA